MRSIFRIIKFTGELWRYYLATGIFTIVLSVLGLLQPLFSGWAIDEIRKGTDASVSYVVWLAVLIFAADLLSNILNNINGFIGDRLGYKLDRLLATRYYQHLMQLPQRFFDTELSGKIISRLDRSVSQLSDYINAMTNNFLQFIVSTLLALGVVAFYSPIVALMLLSLYPIYIYLTTRTSGTWMAYQKDMNENKDIAAGRFAEVINQVKVVKSFIQEKRELTYFRKYRDKVVAIERPQSIFWHKNDFKRRSFLNVVFFGVYLYVFTQAAHGSLSPGQAVALILYSMQIRIPIFTISFLVDRTQRAVSDSKDYFEIMALEPEINDKPGAAELQLAKGAIAFDRVSFGYDSAHMVLKNLTFAIEPYSKVALVGESGEGKTTITNLMMRLYEPQHGVIAIDGQNINDVTQSSLRQHIGVVFQDPALFSGTITENISYAKPNATKKEVIAAAKAANAHEFIEKFEKGYDTQIGERGLKLSGGQKQRIAIARALLKDAPILILDEATSSLDSKSEAMVQEALERLMKQRTTVIIAHRLSTIQHVDQIITIRGGQVDEIGSPAKLAKSGGIYSQLLELQHKATATTKKKLQEFEITS